MTTKQKRPKFLNLFKIHLPVTGVNSIAHRISGAILFFSTPFFIYLFALTLKDASSYAYALVLLDGITGKIILTAVAWSIAHHMLAGIRFLLTDINLGTGLEVAQKTAWFVNISGILLLIFIAYKIWL